MDEVGCRATRPVFAVADRIVAATSVARRRGAPHDDTGTSSTTEARRWRSSLWCARVTASSAPIPRTRRSPTMQRLGMELPEFLTLDEQQRAPHLM